MTTSTGREPDTTVAWEVNGVGVLPSAARADARPPTSQWRIAWAIFRRNRPAMVGLASRRRRHAALVARGTSLISTRSTTTFTTTKPSPTSNTVACTMGMSRATIEL